MRVVKSLLTDFKNFQFSKINPNVALFVLVVMFVVLLFAVENVVKLTLIP